MRIICAALTIALASGCVSTYTGAARPADPSVLNEPGWSAAHGVPAVLQVSEDDCGAAALAMVLAYHRDPAAPAEIPARRAVELRDFARSRGFAAYCISAELRDLEGELAEGRPVLVGVIKPRLDGAVSHYEVVVGFDRRGNRLATLDPARGLTVNSIEGFDREWAAADRLAIVIGAPESGPQGASR